MKQNSAVTIAALRQFASMTNKSIGIILFIFLAYALPTRAQVLPPEGGMLSRDIQVEQYQNGVVVATWPWIDYGVYYTSLLQMSYDPVLPPVRWGVIPGLPDRLVITERAGDGRLLRRFQVSENNYVYEYQTYIYTFQRDKNGFLNVLKDIFQTLPIISDKNSAPRSPGDPVLPFTIVFQDMDQNEPDIRHISDHADFLSQFIKLLKQNLASSRPLSAQEELNMNNTFKGPGTMQILIRPDFPDLPDEIVIKDGQIRVRNTQTTTRGYVDRLGWRKHVLFQNKLYQEWKSKGLTDFPRVK